MDLKTEALQKGFDYLDGNKLGENLIVAGLAAIASPKDIGRRFKDIYIQSHKIHVGQGNLVSAAAALNLAASVNEGMEKQERTLQRRTELVKGIVHGRRRNIERLSD